MRSTTDPSRQMPMAGEWPPAALRADRARVLELFERAWRAGSADALVATFMPVMAEDVVLVHWPMPPTRGRAGFVRFTQAVFGLIEGLQGEVISSEPTPDGLRIELVLTGKLAGRPLSLRSVDDITLRDGLVVRRHAHLEHAVAFRALARPRAVPRAVKATLRMLGAPARLYVKL